MVGNTKSLEERIKARAISLGFCKAGISDASPLIHFHQYSDWLDKGYHAQMEYLSSDRHRTNRQDPSRLLEGVKSILVVGLSYPLHHPDHLQNKDIGLIAGYAGNIDYHIRVPGMLAPLIEEIKEEIGDSLEYKVFSDSAPILERELAVRAGLGWIGKNGCLVTPDFGSNLLLAEIFFNFSLNPDPPFKKDLCGTCSRCIEACPGECILPDRTLDAGSCISFHTIENKDDIPDMIKNEMGNWIFGCDVCQMVCPWNRKSIKYSETASLMLNLPQMCKTLGMSQEDFSTQYSSSAVFRAKRFGFIRNILIRLGNRRDPNSINAVRDLMDSETDRMLLKTAQWALDQIQKKH